MLCERLAIRKGFIELEGFQWRIQRLCWFSNNNPAGHMRFVQCIDFAAARESDLFVLTFGARLVAFAHLHSWSWNYARESTGTHNDSATVRISLRKFKGTRISKSASGM